MTILADTTEYLVEFESGTLTIARRSDGYCLAMKGKRIAGDFRACLKTHSPERVTEIYIRLARRCKWEPLYKPHRIPPHQS